MKYKTQKAGEQQDEFEAKGEIMEARFAQTANETDSRKNWINGTYVQILLPFMLNIFIRLVLHLS